MNKTSLHPLIKLILAISPPSPEVIKDFGKLRRRSAAGDFIGGLLVEKVAPVKERRRYSIPVQGGSIDLLVYWPSTPGPHPVHMFLHGGDWILGTIDAVWIDRLAHVRCNDANCVVVTVNYRKAPEHKFPIPLDDCHAALGWVRDYAQELKVDLTRLTVGGQSAGGNLAAALCLKVRDEGGPAIAAQLLEVPALDMTMTSRSCKDNGVGFGLTFKDMLRMREYYLRSDDDITHPYASPLLAQRPVAPAARVRDELGIRSAA